MRKESWPSISSRSAVSYRMPAMALLSMRYLKINQRLGLNKNWDCPEEKSWKTARFRSERTHFAAPSLHHHQRDTITRRCEPKLDWASYGFVHFKKLL